MKRGQTGGETAHQLTVDELPAHTHTFDDYITNEGTTLYQDILNLLTYLILHRILTKWN